MANTGVEQVVATLLLTVHCPYVSYLDGDGSEKLLRLRGYQGFANGIEISCKFFVVVATLLFNPVE